MLKKVFLLQDCCKHQQHRRRGRGEDMASSAGCFLGCSSPNGAEDENSEEKCDNCDIIACSKECMKLHKPEDHQSMLSSESQKKFVFAWTQFHYFMDCIQCRFG